MISILFIPTICGSNLHLSALAMDVIKPTFPGFRRQRATLSGFSASMATSSTRDGCRRQPKRWLPASRLSSREAIYEACLKRFRPIMMTTMAALLGAVLLAIDFGEGSELRRPLGISIVGGLIVSQILTLNTTPVIYLYLDCFRLWAEPRWRSRHPDPPSKGGIPKAGE